MTTTTPKLTSQAMRATAAWLITLGLCSTSAIAADGVCWLNPFIPGSTTSEASCGVQDSPPSPLGTRICPTPCKTGYTAQGSLCIQACPSGFPATADGTSCTKPASQSRGLGYPWQVSDGITDASSKMLARCQAATGATCEMCGAIAYPTCNPGFQANGCLSCSAVCPSGMQDNGVSCAKTTYNPGTQVVPPCPAGLALGGLSGICGTRASCPAAYPVACGPVCAASSSACASAGLTQGNTLSLQLANLASVGPDQLKGFLDDVVLTYPSPAAGGILYEQALRPALSLKYSSLAQKCNVPFSRDLLDKTVDSLVEDSRTGLFFEMALVPASVPTMLKYLANPWCY